MHLKTVRIKCFRRLKDVRIDLEEDTSIFVGANNSGKTSATHIFYNFLERQRFSLHDFSMDCWKQFDTIGTGKITPEHLPKITLDLWFQVNSPDLHKVIDLLPSLDWNETPIGVRLQFEPKDSSLLIHNYKEASKTCEKGKTEDFHPWPKSLTDYLSKRLNAEYGIRYYILDYSKVDQNLNAVGDYSLAELGNSSENSGAKILKNIIRIDFLNAQRHLSDMSSPGRAEDLSKRMSKFYERNLQQKEDDFEALRSLSKSEAELTNHLEEVFKPTLKSLNELGYPGLSNPGMAMKAALNHEAIVTQHAKLHYLLDNNDTDVILPDSYNGLGFKNLIYMVIELLDFHAAWSADEQRSPLHLILIEGPEAHLHTQLQQVFIKKILEILQNGEEYPDFFKTQLIITTHSPHIIYESGFKPIRYFNRNIGSTAPHTSVVLNLSSFDINDNGFLERYMKLTHCDLFFADAAILVEGNVERLLLPLMIEKVAKQLQSCYLTTIEVGGAYAYRFKELIEFLGITTLVITDLDCVSPKTEKVADDNVQEEDEETEQEGDEKLVNRNGSSCLFDVEDAETSNNTLAQWLPRMKLIRDLIVASEEQKTQLCSRRNSALVYVAFQTPQEICWNGEKEKRAGRTFEEAFALENLDWCQHIDNKQVLGLRVITKKGKFTLKEIHERLFKKIKSQSFRKTDFALGILAASPDQWIVPKYIENGLAWLSTRVLTKLQEDAKFPAKLEGSIEGIEQGLTRPKGIVLSSLATDATEKLV